MSDTINQTRGYELWNGTNESWSTYLALSQVFIRFPLSVKKLVQRNAGSKSLISLSFRQIFSYLSAIFIGSRATPNLNSNKFVHKVVTKIVFLREQFDRKRSLTSNPKMIFKNVRRQAIHSSIQMQSNSKDCYVKDRPTRESRIAMMFGDLHHPASNLPIQKSRSWRTNLTFRSHLEIAAMILQNIRCTSSNLFEFQLILKIVRS